MNRHYFKVKKTDRDGIVAVYCRYPFDVWAKIEVPAKLLCSAEFRQKALYVSLDRLAAKCRKPA